METKTQNDESKDLSKPTSSSQSQPEADKVPISESHAAPITEGAPDPDEDDLDDLDDMLDEFSAVKLDSEAKPPPPTAPKPKAPATEPEDPLEDDFAKQLQAGIADLIGEFDKNPQMQKEFEEMMKQLGAASAVDAGASAPSASKSANPDESFQETIKKTMERMQASGDKATAAAAEDESEDFLAEMMKQMQSGGMGEGSDEDFSKMLMGMMEQLTNKDILYEPMKELDDKFPAWLEKNRATTKPEDLERYLEQQKLTSEIVKKFEETAYSDSNSEMREYIVDRMQKMQAAGSPPEDLVGDTDAARQAFGDPEESCPTQ